MLNCNDWLRITAESVLNSPLKEYVSIPGDDVQLAKLKQKSGLQTSIICDKEIMFSVAFVCLFVCYQHCSKSYERIAMKFYGGVRGGKRNKWLNLGGDLDHHADCPIRSHTVVVTWRHRGEGTLPGHFRRFGGDMHSLKRSWLHSITLLEGGALVQA